MELVNASLDNYSLEKWRDFHASPEGLPKDILKWPGY